MSTTISIPIQSLSQGVQSSTPSPKLLFQPNIDVSPTATAPPRAVDPLPLTTITGQNTTIDAVTQASAPAPGATATASTRVSGNGPTFVSRTNSSSNSNSYTDLNDNNTSTSLNHNVSNAKTYHPPPPPPPPPLSASSPASTSRDSRRKSLFTRTPGMSPVRSTPSRKGKEVFEMTAVPVSRSNGKIGGVAVIGEEGKSREEQAMAKWRKWVVEQPHEVGDTSPIRSRRASPSDAHSHMLPLGPVISPTYRSAGNSPLSAFSPTQNTHGLPVRTGSDDSALLVSPRAVSSVGSPSMEIYCTDSVRALRDVELAVDEEVLERAERAKAVPRRLSTQPRISELPNPFVDIAARLGSRRVRPIVLELIQSLAHFIDAVWCINYPHRPCPWIIGVDESPLPASIRRMNNLHQNLDAQQGWKSPMITAVQEGKEAGYVSSPPTAKDVKFWMDEVTFSIRDVDEVVGIYKGVGWAFSTALRMGIYGDVGSDNVLGNKGEGGGMARLLNDLEEAIWGDAQPRPTDLSYTLPIDFDPYALLDDNELMANAAAGAAAARNRGLSDFFGSHAATPTTVSGSLKTSPEPTPLIEEGDEITYDHLPDLIHASDPTHNGNGDGTATAGGETNSNSDDGDGQGLVSPNLDHEGGDRAKRFGSLPLPMGIEGIVGAEDMTLEELGKRRHQEWLESQRTGGTQW